MLTESIKLSMNEVAYPPSREVIQAAQESLSNLNRYTDPKDLEQLRRLLAQYSGVPREHIILSPGSEFLLREVIHTFSKGREVIIVTPSFFPTVRAAKQFATKLISIQLSPPEFHLNLDVLTDRLDEPSLLIMDNPNNPTGKILVDRQAVEAITTNRDALIVIDEAYYEFCGVTCADMVQTHPNLAVMRTMDKAFSLAGGRIGYAVAGKAFLEALSSFYAFLPQASLYAAVEALSNPDYMRRNVHRVIEERERVWRLLNELAVDVYQSDANFLLMRSEIPDVARKLRDVGILISDLSNQLPLGFIRVSIGTREENDAFIDRYMRIRKAHG